MAAKPAGKKPSGSRPVTPSALAIVPAIYIRVSTEEQAKAGYGLDVQLKRCAAQAIAKGWPEVKGEHCYSDEGLSGTLIATERPELARLLQDIRSGIITAVIILALDRLGRKTSIILDVVEEIADGGAELVSCKESLDTTTPAGRFMLTIFAGLAQMERDNIVERTTTGRNERGTQDGEKGGQLPYGYLRSAAGPVIVRELAAVVKKIDKSNKRGASLRAIATLLNEQAIPGPRGGKWHASSVAGVLANRPAYLGGLRGDSAASWPRVL
jgi:site-specific DNA recombinase